MPRSKPSPGPAAAGKLPVVAPVRLVAEHVYVSVECIHELHDECRGDCRWCATPCRCPCHRL